MLHRSASSRRRRASPNVANSSQSAPSTMRGRRASVATDKPLILPPTSPGPMERQRSPRGSMVPNIALDTESDSPDEVVCSPFYISSRTPNVISLYMCIWIVILMYSVTWNINPLHRANYSVLIYVRSNANVKDSFFRREVCKDLIYYF